MTSKDDLRKPPLRQKEIDRLSAKLLTPCPYCGGEQIYNEEQQRVFCPQRECIRKAGDRASMALFGVPIKRPAGDL